MKQWLKKWLYISLGLLFSQAIQAQGFLNLVPDGSFEDTTHHDLWQNRLGTGCLKTWHGLGTLTNWDCNLWWYCNANRIYDKSNAGLPNYYFLLNSGRTGIGATFIGIYQDYSTAICPCPPTNRSIVKNKLKKQLIAGKEYCATLYVITSERASNVFYTNGLAMYFDNGDLDTVYTIHKDSFGVYTHVQPQVPCPFVINDTLNWMKLQGTFIANGTETVITIGNFLHDTAMQFLPSPPSLIPYDTFRWQGVLIDDVSLIPTDISNWLPDANAYGLTDSVWIGLDRFDYQDGKWFTINNQYITTGPGFWQSPIEVGMKFIHEIEICGVIKRDTLEVINVPTSVDEAQLESGGLNVYPNPNTGTCTLTWQDIQDDRVNVEIVNHIGEAVYMNELRFNSDQVRLDLSLPKGIYMIKAVSMNGRQATAKLMIQ